MCGIAGGLWRSPPADAEQRIELALHRMSHRGPNDRGVEFVRQTECTVALGQTRLSIIDLGSGGHQPMRTPDGRYTLIFNGEIYNYRELRSELSDKGYDFTSASDTEVLLAAWIEWGKSCLGRLEGMFAFVVHDREAQLVTAVRDAFGIKPLFYAPAANGVFFASELAALHALRGRPIRPDLQRAYDYLVHGDYDSGERTFVEGVRHLLPGMLVEVELPTLRLHEPTVWWRAPLVERPAWTFDEAVEAVRERFLHNVRLHLRSDVPWGVALSGGVDSSAIACAVRHLEADVPIHTFSYVARGSEVSEEGWIDLVNREIGAVAHKMVATPGDLVRDLESVIAAQGEPFGSTSIYAQYRVFQLAKESGVTVTLDGQGADELLAGYWGYPGERMLSLWEEGRILDMHRFARAWGRSPQRSYRKAWMYLARTVLPDGTYERARGWSGRRFKPDWLDIPMLADAGVEFREPRARVEFAARGRRVIEQLARSLQVRGLPSLLRHGDRNSMRFSLESRVPFLTPGMAELLLSMPEEYLISPEGETKHVFRAAMRGIVPDAILDRKDKIGFVTPEQQWLLAIAPTVREWLKEAGDIAFLRGAKLLRRFDAICEGRVPFTWQVWRWINYAKWHASQEIS